MTRWVPAALAAFSCLSAAAVAQIRVRNTPVEPTFVTATIDALAHVIDRGYFDV